MGSSGGFGDPKSQTQEAVRQIRAELQGLRESLIQAILRRNQAQTEATRLERLVADLETKAALAEKIKTPTLAAELREERARRQKDLEETVKLVALLEARAEAAKIALPEEETRLQRKANELQAGLAEATAQCIEIGDPETEALWDRAAGKTRALQNEAGARAEAARIVIGPPREALPGQPAPASAEQLLAELEARLQLPAVGTAIGGSVTTIPSAGTSTSPADPRLTAGEQPLASAPADAGSPAKTFSVSDAQRAVPPAPGWTMSRIKGETVQMEPTQRVRIAAVGTGSIFCGAHLPAYPDIAQAQLVAICDPDKDAQTTAYRRYASLMEAKIKQAKDKGADSEAERLTRDLDTVQLCDDISEVIESIKPDLVDICTQPVLHAPLSIQALEAGLHVMCEKPISRSWLESQRVIEAVKRTGKLYQHNENWLWDPDWYTAKKLVDSGAIGEPILMFLATAHGGPEGRTPFWNSDFGGGGALLDNGIHAIGASWYVSGFDKRPTFVKAAEPFGMSTRMPNRIIGGRFQKVTVDDDAHILIRFENQDTLAWSTAHVEGSWSHRDSPDTVVIGTTGKIVFVSEENRRYAVVMDAYDREARRIEVSGPTWQHWPSSFYGEILNMVECVRANAPSISNAEFGAECSAIVGASYLSERDGRRAVHVEEFKSFARDIAGRYSDDPTGADNALVDALLSAVRK